MSAISMIPEIDSNTDTALRQYLGVNDGFAVSIGAPGHPCSICHREPTYRGDVCADCWTIICAVHLPGETEWLLHPELHRWTRCENDPECHEPTLCLLHTQAWIRAYQLTRILWPVWAASPIGGNPNETPLDFKAHYQYPNTYLARIVQDALEHPHIASTDPWIKTSEQWEKFGSDRLPSRHQFQDDPWPSVFRVIHAGNFTRLQWPTEQKIKISDPFVKPVEGTLHVRCRMPGCTSEYVSNEKPSPKGVRYVCSKHTDAQLKRARILKTERTDRNVHFDEPEYFFNHTTPQSSREWERSSWAFKDFQGHQGNAQYASDSNGRNDSDRGHSPTCGVHRPNKSAPFKPAYKPVDPVEALELSRSAWEKNVRVIQYPLQTRLAGIQLVPAFAISFPAGYVVRGQHIPFQVGKVWIKCACGRIAQCFSPDEPHIIPPSPPRCPHGFMIFGEEFETGLSLKCTMCAVSQDLRRLVQILPDPVYRRELNRPFTCPDCDPTVTKVGDIYIYHRKDDVDQRESPLFSARRGDTGEGIEDVIPTETLAQEQRLNEIITRWQQRVEFIKKQNLIDDETPKQQVVEFLKTELKKDKNFQHDVTDVKAIEEGEPLKDRMASKRRRDQMNDRIIRSSEFDFRHPDLDWAKLLKPGSKEAKLVHQGGTFIVVKQDRWRIYRLGDYDLPISSNGRSVLGLTEPFLRRVNAAMENARKAARKRGLDENVAAAIARQEFLSAEVFWVRRVRKGTTVLPKSWGTDVTLPHSIVGQPVGSKYDRADKIRSENAASHSKSK